MKGHASLRFVGDIMLGASVAEKIKIFGPSFPFEKLPVDTTLPDIFFGNLECVIFSDSQTPKSKKIVTIQRNL
jgi:hypothetical protein